MRIDLYLVENNMAKSRSRARALIEAGNVVVNGESVTKASYKMVFGDVVLLKQQDFPYVSRGALKLKAILDATEQRFDDKVVLDMGSSTGGFTEVALEYGASKVFAVDVGTDQLDSNLRLNESITVMEQTDGRNLEALNPAPSIYVSDVSFISQTKILPTVLEKQTEISELYILIKPQFELSPKEVGRGGLVRDEKARNKACERVKECVKECGFKIKHLMSSPIAGGDGNQEYLLYGVKV